MGKGSQPKQQKVVQPKVVRAPKVEMPPPPEPAPPPVAATSADTAQKAVNSRKRKKAQYGSSDTLLSQGSNGFTYQDLDPRASL